MRRRGSYSRRCHGGDGVTNLLVLIFLAIVAMPLFGGYLFLTGKDESSKLLGGALFVVGIIIWLVLGMK